MYIFNMALLYFSHGTGRLWDRTVPLTAKRDLLAFPFHGEGTIMLIKKRCTVCNEDVEAHETVTCGSCENAIHVRCAEFESTYLCAECAEEREIGAVEF